MNCPKCGSEMLDVLPIDSNHPIYWWCEKCGHEEEFKDGEK
jgi:DNA-directed RNA polymerase subunit M/transcription elongation factor TFIIS